MKPRVKPALKKASRVDRCGPYGKRRYRTKAGALAALEELRAIAADPTHPDHTRRHERRVHSCDFCGGWHLTSQS